MMSWRAWAAFLGTAMLVAACGGGGSSAGTPGLGGGGTTNPAADLTVTLSSVTMPNSVDASVVATVTAVDANRATLADIPVTLSVDAGATVQASADKTDASGRVTGTVRIGSNTALRRITITATSGTLTRTAVVDVIAGGTTAPQAADMTITLSSSTMPNSVSATVVATITAVDANRATLADIPVTLSVDSGATVLASAAKTDSSGRITGTVRIGSDTTPRRITVTALSGSLSRSAVIDVVAITATDLSLTLSPSAILSNSGTASVVATVTAVDGNRATVSGIPVTMSVNSGATIQTNASVTDANGQVTGTIRIGDDKANRTIVVTAVSGGITRTASIQVTGSKINSTLLGAVLAPGQTGSIQYRLVDANGNPIPGKTIVVTGPGGVQTSATTGGNGEYDYSFTAPNLNGTLDIRAAAAGVDSVVTVLVNAGVGTIPVVTVPVRSASVSANPSVVPINTGTTSHRSEIRALFLSNDNAPVRNIRVRFDLDGDPNSIGGSFTSGTTQVYSDASGVATSAFVPGGRFSPADGVKIRACWDYADFAAGTCPNAARTTLTVISDALSVSIGTNNLIGDGATGLTYVTRYVVQVVDSSGLAAKDVQVSASVDLLRYYKGFWTRGLDFWFQEVKASCANEDLNRNGVAEVFSNGVVEDANGSFNLTAGRPALEPRKADVAISFEGSTKTDASGQVTMRIEYPQNIGSWVRFNVVVSASGVAGTEGRANFEDVLNVPASAVNNVLATPPFVLSPYGLQTSGLIAVSMPGSTKVELLCTNPF